MNILAHRPNILYFVLIKSVLGYKPIDFCYNILNTKFYKNMTVIAKIDSIHNKFVKSYQYTSTVGRELKFALDTAILHRMLGIMDRNGEL